MSDCLVETPDGSVPTLRFDGLHEQGICWECRMKHFPFCDSTIVLCRSCGCGKSWHPLDGPCRVGPETEFTLYDCHCRGYIPKENLAYLEWKLNNK